MKARYFARVLLEVGPGAETGGPRPERRDVVRALVVERDAEGEERRDPLLVQERQGRGQRARAVDRVDRGDQGLQRPDATADAIRLGLARAPEIGDPPAFLGLCVVDRHLGDAPDEPVVGARLQAEDIQSSAPIPTPGDRAAGVLEEVDAGVAVAAHVRVHPAGRVLGGEALTKGHGVRGVEQWLDRRRGRARKKGAAPRGARAREEGEQREREPAATGRRSRRMSRTRCASWWHAWDRGASVDCGVIEWAPVKAASDTPRPGHGGSTMSKRAPSAFRPPRP